MNTVFVHAHHQPISALAVSDGLLVTGSSDSSVKIWTIVDEGTQTLPLYPLDVPDCTGL